MKNCDSAFRVIRLCRPIEEFLHFFAAASTVAFFGLDYSQSVKHSSCISISVLYGIDMDKMHATI